MTVREALIKGTKALLAVGIEDGENDARLLLLNVLGISQGELLLRYTEELALDKEKQYFEVIARRSEHYPCQYIIGSQDFFGYEFLVGEGVLIPRQETELLVEKALSETKQLECAKVLDMCCGTGCIGISYYLKRGGRDKLTLADISDAALAIAKDNVQKHGVNADIKKSDLFKTVDGKYDIIMSNPPYIKSAELDCLMPEVREYEPRLALDGMEDGLFFYREIIKKAPDFLEKKGWLIFETGFDQGPCVAGLLEENGFKAIEVKKDYAGLDRIVSARYEK